MRSSSSRGITAPRRITCTAGSTCATPASRSTSRCATSRSRFTTRHLRVSVTCRGIRRGILWTNLGGLLEMRFSRIGRVVAAIVVIALAVGASSAQARVIKLGEYRLSSAKLDQLRSDWVGQITSRYAAGSWAPMKFDLTDRDLRLMGLPSKRVITSHRYPVPTAVYPNGKMVRLTAQSSSKGGGGKGGGGKTSGGSSGGSTAAAPGVATFAGTGFAGIRPGAWLLTVTDDEVGWCSMAHVYGAPGSYQVSTPGHCGKNGDLGTVIGVVGNHTFNGAPVPVLLDFGKYSRSTGDGGIGKDWALISVDPAYQNLVTPAMAFWGGPFGIYRKTGAIVAANLFAGSGPTVSVTPDPLLAQGVVHYGHGV